MIVKNLGYFSVRLKFQHLGTNYIINSYLLLFTLRITFFSIPSSYRIIHFQMKLYTIAKYVYVLLMYWLEVEAHTMIFINSSQNKIFQVIVFLIAEHHICITFKFAHKHPSLRAVLRGCTFITLEKFAVLDPPSPSLENVRK